MATVSSFPGMRTKNLLSVSQGSNNAWGGQSQESEDVWGQFVSITPNTSQVDVRSLVENGSIRSEMYKRRDSEQEMVGSPTQMGSPRREDSLNYKLPPGDDYSFSDCIISSPETKSASKISERASPNLRPYRVVNSRSTRSGPVTCRQRRGPRKVQQHVPGSNDDDRVGNLPTITEQSRKKRKKGTFSRIISTIFCC